MRKSRLLRGALATSWALAACTGFDPSKLFPARPEAEDSGAAGWSYDGDAQAGRGVSAGRGGGGAQSDGALRGGGGGGRELTAGNANDGGQTPSARGGSSGAAELTPNAGEGGASGADDAAGGGSASRPGYGGTNAHGAAGAGGAGAHAGGGSSQGGGGAAHGGRAGASSLGGSGGHALGGAAGNAMEGASGAPNGGVASGASAGGANNAGSAGTANGTPRGLWFSEYVEGSGKYKALELEGPAGTPLDGCEIATYSNGASTPGTLALAATIGDTGAYVLCSSTLAEEAGVRCDRSTNLSFNGNDAVALVCDGVTLDVIGEIGFDPGVAWTNGDVSTANRTLRRRCGITLGDANGADAFDPALEWVALPADTVDGLGDPSCG